MPSQKSEVAQWVGQTHPADWWGFWWFQQQGIPSVLAAHVRALSAGTFKADDVKGFGRVGGGALVLERMKGYALRDQGDDVFKLERLQQMGTEQRS